MGIPQALGLPIDSQVECALAHGLATQVQLCVSKKLSSRSLVASEQIVSTEKILIQCISKVSRNPSLIVIVDSSAETLLHAKRMGMACIGVSMNASSHCAFGIADKVIVSLHDMTIDTGLSAILGSFARNVSPMLETAHVSDNLRGRVRSRLVSSSFFDRIRKFDTFADEYDSDRN